MGKSLIQKYYKEKKIMPISFLCRSQPASFFAFEEALFWIIYLGKITAKEVFEAKKFLDQSVLDKAEKMVFEEDRRRTIIVQAIIRFYLGKLLGQESSKINILRSNFGKPYLKNNPFYFNLSHTKEYAFFAVHPLRPIGVDVEMIQDDLDILNVADVSMHPHERMEILKSDEGRLDRFFSLWCAKEAMFKALGTGFSSDTSPILSFANHPCTHIDLYRAMDLEVYVYHEKIENHKIAICLNMA